MQNVVLLAFAATLCTWFITAMGAATVAFFKNANQKAMNLMLGFSAGVMIAASFWSLLEPAIDRAETYLSVPPWFVAVSGFLAGTGFMWLCDKVIRKIRQRSLAGESGCPEVTESTGHLEGAEPRLADGQCGTHAECATSRQHADRMKGGEAEQAVKLAGNESSGSAQNARREGRKKRGISRAILLVISITLHNIPEGLAVGVAFGALSQSGHSTEALMGAISIAVGIGIQNFPEGAAVSVPLRREGFSRMKCFLIGQATALVEPISGVIGAALVIHIQTMLPYALAFAAGAMVLVAVHELIPQCQEGREEGSFASTLGIMGGFAVMMLLDVALG